MKRITFTFILQIVLTVLFVVGHFYDMIDWSWWWILSPLWAPMAFMIALVVAYFTITALAACTCMWLLPDLDDEN